MTHSRVACPLHSRVLEREREHQPAWCALSRLKHANERCSHTHTRVLLCVLLVDVLTILLTSASTLLVSQGMSGWVPLNVAAVSAITTASNQLGLRPKLRAANEAITKLNQLKLWWQGLTLIQKRDTSNKTYLVNETEMCHLVELNSYVSASVAANKPQDDEAEEQQDGKKRQ